MTEETKKKLKKLQTAYPVSHMFPEENLEDAYVDYFYDGLLGSGKEYRMSIYDLDEIAWLNTLLGYQLPWKDALQLNRSCQELGHEVSVLELSCGDKSLVKKAAANAGLSLDLSKWVAETPKVICYSFAET